MGRKSNLKKIRKQLFGSNFGKTAKELMRKADLVAHADTDPITGREYTIIYNPVKRLLKMKPYKSEKAKQILAATVEKYGSFLKQKADEAKKDSTVSGETNIKMTKENN